MSPCIAGLPRPPKPPSPRRRIASGLEAACTRNAPPTTLIGLALIGAAVSVAIGVYDNVGFPEF